MPSDECPPKPRSRKLYVLWATALTLLTLIGLGCAFWRPIGLAVMSYRTELRFRDNFRDKAKLHVAISSADWAVAFGGTHSLGRLAALAEDERISLTGRAQARLIRTTVLKGVHLDYIKSMIDDRNGLPSECVAPGGMQGALLQYIYERDNEYLKKPKFTESAKAPE